MVQPCRTCDEPSTRRCSGCTTPTAWYCSEKCQRTLWVLHIFECNPRKPINTAYHLARAVFQDRFPDDLQTCEDYGFERAFTIENRSNLLGLYQGLINCINVEPKAIHRWRLKGTLVEEIKMAFETLPEDNRDAAHETMLRGWQYAGGSSSATLQEINVTKATWPEHKQQCFGFCTALQSGWHPAPEQTIWLTFGFCVCRDEYSETPLAQLYRQLITECSFDEIYSAYESSSLIALFDAKGLKGRRESIQHLEDILAGTPKGNKSVWNLKRHVVVEDGWMIRSIAVDYGFVNCKGEAERLELKEVYKQYFARLDGDPIKLHDAAIRGKLFEHVGGLVKLKKKFNRIMKNPYPLSVI